MKENFTLQIVPSFYVNSYSNCTLEMKGKINGMDYGILRFEGKFYDVVRETTRIPRCEDEGYVYYLFNNAGDKTPVKIVEPITENMLRSDKELFSDFVFMLLKKHPEMFTKA